MTAERRSPGTALANANEVGPGYVFMLPTDIMDLNKPDLCPVMPF